MGPEQQRRIDAASRVASTILSMAYGACVQPRDADLVAAVDQLAYMVEVGVFAPRQYHVHRGTVTAARRRLHDRSPTSLPHGMTPKMTPLDALTDISKMSTELAMHAADCAESLAVLARPSERWAYTQLAHCIGGGE